MCVRGYYPLTHMASAWVESLPRRGTPNLPCASEGSYLRLIDGCITQL